MSELEDLIRVVKEKDEKIRYNMHKDLYDATREFIIQKKRILYGGTALNEMLPLIDKFYPATQLPDYDIYTPSPYRDAMDLAVFLKKKGYHYIEIKKSLWHKTTFKVYAEFQGVADFTYVRPSFYKFLLDQSAGNPVKNQSDKRLILSPPTLLLLSFYQELARPRGSLHRLVKIIPRLKSFLKHFRVGTDRMRFDVPIDSVYDMSYVKPVMEYIREQRIPDIGGFAIGLHLGQNRWNRLQCCICPGLPVFDLLSMDMDATVRDLRKCLPPFRVQSVRVSNLREILPAQYSLLYSLPNGREKIFMRIIDGSAGCYAVETIAGYRVGSINTILFHFYGILISQMFFKNRLEGTEAASFTRSIIKELEQLNSRKPVRERYTLRCTGVERTMEDILKDNWGKRGLHVKI
jgi:hypothetical protein